MTDTTVAERKGRPNVTIRIPQDREALDDSRPPLDEELIMDLVLLLRFHPDDDYLYQSNGNGKRQRHPSCPGRIGFEKRARKEAPLPRNT